MPPSTIPLTAVDEVKVTILVDNSLDLLIPGSEVAERFLFSPRWLAATVVTVPEVPTI